MTFDQLPIGTIFSFGETLFHKISATQARVLGIMHNNFWTLSNTQRYVQDFPADWVVFAVSEIAT